MWLMALRLRNGINIGINLISSIGDLVTHSLTHFVTENFHRDKVQDIDIDDDNDIGTEIDIVFDNDFHFMSPCEECWQCCPRRLVKHENKVDKECHWTALAILAVFWCRTDRETDRCILRINRQWQFLCHQRVSKKGWPRQQESAQNIFAQVSLQSGRWPCCTECIRRAPWLSPKQPVSSSRTFNCTVRKYHLATGLPYLIVPSGHQLIFRKQGNFSSFSWVAVSGKLQLWPSNKEEPCWRPPVYDYVAARFSNSWTWQLYPELKLKYMLQRKSLW